MTPVTVSARSSCIGFVEVMVSPVVVAPGFGGQRLADHATGRTNRLLTTALSLHHHGTRIPSTDGSRQWKDLENSW